MTPEQALDVLRAALRQVAPDASLDDVAPGDELQDCLELDSMDFLNLMVSVEQQTGLAVPERDYPALATIDGFVGYLAGHLT
jgi:acyl carrier protein